MSKIGPEVWEKIRKALPIQKTPDDYQIRTNMWKQIDVNGNGYLSLAQVDKGVRDVIQVQQLFDLKPALIRAFQAAKNKVKTKNTYGSDYVERCQFRILLLCLRQYFQYWQAFDRIDSDDDRRITLQEFTAAQGSIQKWVGPIANMQQCFFQIDVNGGGKILFDEFCKWAINKSLDLQDDDDYDNLQ